MEFMYGHSSRYKFCPVCGKKLVYVIGATYKFICGNASCKIAIRNNDKIESIDTLKSILLSRSIKEQNQINNMLNINNIKKLRITKIKSNKIYFKFENTRYKLTQKENENNLAEKYLYKYSCVNTKDSKYEYLLLTQQTFEEDIHDFIITVSKKHNVIVYGQVVLEYFVRKLTIHNLVSSLYSQKIDECKENILIKEMEIQKLNAEIHQLEREKIQCRIAGLNQLLAPPINQRCKEYKFYTDGDWCITYNDTYGNTHPEYGGKLTDLRSLPENTIFSCTNGAWNGIIVLDNNGKKCVVVINSTLQDIPTLLTDLNNAAYIKIDVSEDDE